MVTFDLETQRTAEMAPEHAPGSSESCRQTR